MRDGSSDEEDYPMTETGWGARQRPQDADSGDDSIGSGRDPETGLFRRNGPLVTGLAVLLTLGIAVVFLSVVVVIVANLLRWAL